MELRPYQKNGVEFITKSVKQNLPIGIQAPTGSGKSFIIMEACRRLLEEGRKDIWIVTGFNTLIWQLQKTANYFNLPNEVILGRSYMRPAEECGGDPDAPLFGTCPNSKCKNCKENYSYCSKGIVSSIINSNKPRVVITNHAYFISTMSFRKKPSVVFIDEAHVFDTFYDSYMTKTVEDDVVADINKFLNKNKFYKNIFENAQLGENAIKSFSKMISTDNQDAVERGLNIMYSGIKVNSYYNRDTDPYTRTYFYYRYPDMAENLVLVSATLDLYTCNLFGLSKKLTWSIGTRKDRFVGSEFVLNYKNFLDGGLESSFKKCLELGRSKGLILCTSIEHVNRGTEILQRMGIPVYNTVSSFEKSNDKVKCLIGSKKFFQGLDIPEIDFTILNCIPFDSYDKLYKERCDYIRTVARKDPWTYYTIPKLKNTILQSLGRTHRSQTDQGTVCICDERLGKRFTWIKDWYLDLKPGMRCVEVNKDDAI